MKGDARGAISLDEDDPLRVMILGNGSFQSRKG